MTNTIATTINTLDTIATVSERTLRITGTILWLAAFTAVAITGACYNATYEARESYAAATLQQTNMFDGLQAERYMLPAAAETPALTFEAFVTQALLDAPMLAPALPTESPAKELVAQIKRTDRAMAALKTTVTTLTINEAEQPLVSWSYDQLMQFKTKQLKAMAKAQGIKGYGSMRKAQLAEALAA